MKVETYFDYKDMLVYAEAEIHEATYHMDVTMESLTVCVTDADGKTVEGHSEIKAIFDCAEQELFAIWNREPSEDDPVLAPDSE